MMNFRKIRRNVKAISPVISVLLMIAVAVAASLVTYAWVMGYLGFTTTKVGKAIQIQSAAHGTPATSLDVWVQNVGDGAFKLTADCLYVDGVLYTQASAPGTMSPGDTIKLTATGVFTGATYPKTVEIRAVTEDGTFIERSWTFDS
jgi:flagellin-like protein